MTYDPHEPEIADFVVVAVHELRHGDTLLDLGTELSAQIVMVRSVDLSEPGDAGLAEITVHLAWRGEVLARTMIIADMLDLRIIETREGRREPRTRVPESVRGFSCSPSAAGADHR